MSKDYPWYDIVEDDSLEQGDILFNCPVIEVASEASLPLSEDNPPVVVSSFDIIVLTQSCDLVNDKKVDSVLLCPHWSVDALLQASSPLAERGALKDIIGGRRHRYILLNISEDARMLMTLRVVDLSRVFQLPLPFFRQLVASQTPRLRLRSPYKEHLSQAFARFFMRVGLPQDIELT